MPQKGAAARWSDIIDRQEKSGQSIKAFAATNGLNASTLAWWRSRLGRVRKLDETFVEVAVSPQLEQGEALDRTVVLALDEYRAHLVIDEETDLRLLRRVLESLC